MLQFLFHLSVAKVGQKMEENHPILIAVGLNLEGRNGEKLRMASGWSGQGEVKMPHMICS